MSFWKRDKIDPGMKLFLTMLAAQDDNPNRATAEAIGKVNPDGSTSWTEKNPLCHHPSVNSNIAKRFA